MYKLLLKNKTLNYLKNKDKKIGIFGLAHDIYYIKFIYMILLIFLPILRGLSHLLNLLT